MMVFKAINGIEQLARELPGWIPDGHLEEIFYLIRIVPRTVVLFYQQVYLPEGKHCYSNLPEPLKWKT